MAKKTKDPDLLHWDKAMRDHPHLDQWLEAAAKEIKTLKDKGCWAECPMSEAKEAGQKIIPCQWALRVKKSPSGEILKFKGRIVLRGDLMDQTKENFSPVCVFSAVWFFLVSAVMLGWITHSADFTSAFPQAELEEPPFMSTPRGFRNKHGKDGCL